uniref:Uncharacterized protein n=1 Tax=Rhizophora mucronata TaxID=61149 RepID=A0A2P2J976_RHIMU
MTANLVWKPERQTRRRAKG